MQCAERQCSGSGVRTIPSELWEWLTLFRRFKHPSLLASSVPFERHVLSCCPSGCSLNDLGLVSWCLLSVVSDLEPREQHNEWLQLRSSLRALELLTWSVIAGHAAWAAGWELSSQLSLLQKTERKGHFELFIISIIQIFEQLVF